MPNKAKSLQAPTPADTVLTAHSGENEFIELYERHYRPGMGPVPLFALSDYPETANIFEGEYYLWRYHKTCSIGIRDFKVLKNFSISSNLQNVLSLEFILSGGVDVELCGHEILNTGMPRAYLTSHQKKGQQTRIYRAGDHIKSVGLWIPPELLREEFGLELAQTSAAIQDIVNLDTQSTATLPLSGKLLAILEDVVNNPFKGMRAEKYLEGKIMELLCHFCELLCAPQEQVEVDNSLPRHKAQAMKAVLQILKSNIAHPPDPEDLARQVGMSRSTMTNTFKASFGLTLGNYLLQRRMELSHELLRGGKLSVMEVAITVGYEDQSAFGRAYKKFFGHAPREDQPGAGH